MLEVIVRVQIVGLGCLYNAVDDGTGLRTGDRVDHQPVPATYCKVADRGFCQVIIKRDLSVLQKLPQVFLLVDAVLYASPSILRQQKSLIVCCLIDPRKEGVNEWADFFVTLLLTFFSGKFLQLVLCMVY